MTRQEALKELESLTIDYGKRTEEEIERLDEAVDMAIAALKADTVDRQSVIDSLYDWADHCITDAEAWHLRQVAGDIKTVLSVPVMPQPEEDCDTCKHGYFGDRQCDNCRVRYPSHYEREGEQQND